MVPITLTLSDNSPTTRKNAGPNIFMAVKHLRACGMIGYSNTKSGFELMSDFFREAPVVLKCGDFYYSTRDGSGRKSDLTNSWDDHLTREVADYLKDNSGRPGVLLLDVRNRPELVEALAVRPAFSDWKDALKVGTSTLPTEAPAPKESSAKEQKRRAAEYAAHIEASKIKGELQTIEQVVEQLLAGPTGAWA